MLERELLIERLRPCLPLLPRAFDLSIAHTLDNRRARRSRVIRRRGFLVVRMGWVTRCCRVCVRRRVRRYRLGDVLVAGRVGVFFGGVGGHSSLDWIGLGLFGES